MESTREPESERSATVSDHATDRSILQSVSRRRRRCLVLMMYVCLVVIVGIFAFADQWWRIIVLVPMLYVLIAYSRLVTPITKELTELKADKLDERQVMIRNHAYYQAYKMFGMVFVVAFSYTMLASLTEAAYLPTPATTRDFALLVLLFSLLFGSLPASVIAWTEPDPESE